MAHQVPKWHFDVVHIEIAQLLQKQLLIFSLTFYSQCDDIDKS